jgi:hypothetical protein
MNEEQLRAELAAVYASRSWKITAPLRRIIDIARRSWRLLREPRRIPGVILRRAGRYPAMRHLGGKFLLRVSPALHARVLAGMAVPAGVTVSYVMAPAAEMQTGAATHVAVPELRIPAAARDVFAELCAARRQSR